MEVQGLKMKNLYLEIKILKHSAPGILLVARREATMADPVLLGERIIFEVVPSTGSSRRADRQLLWHAKKVARFVGDHHYAKIAAQGEQGVGGIVDLISFKSRRGTNLIKQEGSSGGDDVVRYGVEYTLRVLSNSKAGGRYLAPLADKGLVWDRHVEQLRSEYEAQDAIVATSDDKEVNELFRVIHPLATNLRRDWIEDPAAAGEALVPSARFALVHVNREREDKKCYVAFDQKSESLQLVGSLSAASVFAIRRVDVAAILREEDLDDAQIAGKDGEALSELVECQRWGGSFNPQWVARKNAHFVTTDNKIIKGMDLPSFWSADGLGRWRVECRMKEGSTDSEGWMYGTSWSKMFHKGEPVLAASHESKRSYRLRKWVRFESRDMNEYHPTQTSAAGEAIVPRYRLKGAGSRRASSEIEGGTEEKSPSASSLGRNSEANTKPRERVETSTLELAFMSIAGGHNSFTMKNAAESGIVTEEVFEKLDADGDGVVSFTEFKERASAIGLVKANGKLNLRAAGDSMPVWAGQMLPKPLEKWSGPITLTRKFHDDPEVLDYALRKRLIDEVDGEVANKESGIGAESKIQRPQISGSLAVDGKAKTAVFTVPGRAPLTIDLNQLGWCVKSVEDAASAHSSLDADLRRKAVEEIAACEAAIEDLQQKRAGSTNKASKKRITSDIETWIERKVRGRDQMLGRPRQQGWLQLLLKGSNGKILEISFSPGEPVSSFISSSNENERGKKEVVAPGDPRKDMIEGHPFRNEFERCRQVLIDALPDSNAMRKSLAKDLLSVQNKLAGMKKFTTENAATEVFKKFASGTKEMAEIDERIDGYQARQHDALKRIEKRILDVENGNLATELANGLKEWVADIQEAENDCRAAAVEGLEMLDAQMADLEACSQNIIDAAKQQALLTLQYGVPYLPRGNSDWRREIEEGKTNKSLHRLAKTMTSSVATVTGVPVPIIEGKTGLGSGGPTNLKDRVLGTDENGDTGEEKEVEMVEVEIDPKTEIDSPDSVGAADGDPQSENLEDEPLTDEAQALLQDFIPEKQPEEFWYENHRLCFQIMCVLCLLNIVLIIVVAALPPLQA